MSNEPPPAKKLPLHRRFLPTTIAGKAAVTTALLLTAVLVVVWILRLFGSDSVRLIHAVSVTHMIIEFALVGLIPIVLYWGIRRWNQVIEGEYPEIDRAWEAGIEALRAKGVALSDYPVFLILGSSTEGVEHGLMEALDTKMSIHGVPDASGVSHALQWYMSSDAIYLFCPGASSLSALMSRWTAPTLSSGPRQSLARRSENPSANPSAGTSSAAGGASSDPNSSQIGIPKIQRVERSAGAPAPSVPRESAAKAEPAMLKKESSMRPGSPPNNSGPAAQDSYLGTIQHHSIDSSPRESSMRDTAARPPSGGAPFDMPAAKPNPQPFSPPASDAGGDALRPAPRYQGTISFDQYPSAPQASPATQPGPSEPPAPRAAATESRPAGFVSSSTIHAAPNAMPASKETVSKRSDGAAAASKPAASKPAGAIAMPRGSAGKKIALPASLDTSDQLPRLKYVCKLLKRSRRPMCGINGAITLLPFELSRVGPLQLSAIAQSVRGDISTIQDTLGIRSPVTAVLVGLEQDKGFAELVRRLQSGLLSRRLGGRFDLRSRPTPEELNTHSDRLCDAFEDWVYRLFSREDGLEQQRGNRKLYALTCKIRHELKPRLRIVLGQAFGCESSESVDDANDDDSFFFSGCYFAASGAMSGQPAFVKGVLQDKLFDEQSKVQWTKQSLRTHRLFQTFSILGWILCLILLAVLIAKQFL